MPSADDLAELAELRARERMAGIIFDSVIATCAQLLKLYDDDLSWDEVIGIAAEEIADSRSA